MESFWQDIRFALRSYGQTPAFTAVVVCTLGLGLGTTGAIFSVVNGVLLQPLAFRKPSELVLIDQAQRATGKHDPISPPNYFDIVEQCRSLSAVAAYWSPSVSISGPGGDPEKVLAATVFGELFTVLGTPARLGRVLGPEDARAGADRVAVLSYGLWQRRFGGDPQALGRELTLDGNPTRIVGVMPPAFDFPAAGTELWVPLRLSRTQPPNAAIPAEAYRQYRILNVVARIRGGATVETLQSELDRLGAQLERRYPDANHGLTLSAVSLREAVVGSARAGLLLLLGAVACLLLIACANVGGLMLARGLTRRREMAVRIALGASRRRLAGQLLTESTVVAMAGGALGLLLMVSTLDVVVHLAPAGLPGLGQVRVDGRVVAFVFSLAGGVGFLFGMFPALSVRGEGLSATLRAAGRGSVSGTHRRTRQVLVAVEIGLSLMLLIGAALLLQSFVRIQQVDPGFRSAGVLTVDRIELPRARSEAAESAEFFRQLLDRVRALPGIEAAGITLGLPADARARFFVDETTFVVEGAAPVPRGQRPTAALHVTSPGYFTALSVPLERGRFFDDDDRGHSPPVAIIDETLARRLWPLGDAIGKRITHDLSIVPSQPVSREIVGIVGDVRSFSRDQPSEGQLFIPHQQMPWPSMALVVRARAGAETFGPELRGLVRALDPTIPVPPARTLDAIVAEGLSGARFRATLLSLFAVTAATLAMIGVYGAMSYSVEQRRREIGLRLAIGATPGQVSAMLVGSGLKTMLAGVLLGVAGALAGVRVLARMLYGIQTYDTATFVVLSAVILAAATIACYLPARRIGATGPLRSLAEE